MMDNAPAAESGKTPLAIADLAGDVPFSELFNVDWMDKRTAGLPDRCAFNDLGKVTPEKLFVFLGMNRANRRKLKLDEVFGFYMSQATRGYKFRSAVSHFLSQGHNVPLEGDELASWEAQVFERYRPGWLFAQASVAAFNADQQLAGPAVTAWWNEDCEKYRSLKSNRTLQKDLQKFRRFDDKLTHIFDLLVPVYQCLWEDMRLWKNKTEAERGLLADVCFAVFSLFGPAAIKPIAVKGIADFWKGIIALDSDENNEVEERALRDTIDCSDMHVATSELAKSTQPTSMQEFYIELVSLVEAGARTPNDLAYADSIHTFVTHHLPRLRKRPVVDQATLEQKIRAFAIAIIAFGNQIGMDLFSDQTFVEAFTKAWTDFIFKSVQEPVSEFFISDILTDIGRLVGENKEKLDIIKTALDVAAEAVSAALSARDNANFFAKRVAAALVIEAEASLRQAEADRDGAEVEIATEILPPGCDFDNLDKYLDPARIVILDATLVHPDSVPAIVNFSALAIEGHSNKGSTGSGQDSSRLNPEDAATNHWSPTSEPTPVTIVDLSNDAVPLPLVAEIPIVEVPYKPEEIVISYQQPTLQPIALVQPPPTEVASDGYDYGNGAEQAGVPQIIEDPSILAGRLESTLAHDGLIQSALIDSAILHWLAENDLPSAIQTLILAKGTDLDIHGECLDEDLLQIAYAGMHVWPQYDASMGSIRVNLNFLSPQRVDQLLQQRQTKAVVPGLLFAACFQTAIFGANETTAPALLAHIKDFVDPPIQRLIREVIANSNRNICFDIDGLRLVTPTESIDARIREVQSKLDDLQLRVEHKHTGWAPLRKAIAATFELPQFARAIEAVKNDKVEHIDDVAALLAQYDTDEARRALFDEQIKRSDVALNSVIGRTPINAFNTALQDLRDVCVKWLRLRSVRNDRAAEIVESAQRLISASRTARTHLSHKLASVTTVAQKANNVAMHSAIARLLDAVDGNADIMWSPEIVHAGKNAPLSALRLSWPSNDRHSDLIHLTDMLSHPLDPNVIFDKALLVKDSVTAQVLLKTSTAITGGAEKRDALQALESQLLSDTLKNVQKAERLLENAMLAEIFDDQLEPTQKQQAIDGIKEAIDARSVYDGYGEICDGITRIEREIEQKLGRRLEVDETALKDRMSQLVEKMGPDAVPVEWRKRAEQALQSRMLPMLTEMMVQLDNSIATREKLPDIAMERNVDLDAFVAAQGMIYEALVEHPNPREVWRSLTALSKDGIDFNHVRKGTREVVETLSEWSKDRRLAIDSTMQTRTREILTFLGLDVTATVPRINRADGPFRALTMIVKRGNTGRGLPFFEGELGSGNEQNEIRVFVGVGEWRPTDLIECIEREAFGQRDILVSPKLMSNAMREELASATKLRNRTIYHIDPVMAAHIGLCNVAEDKVLKTWLRMSAPWTGFNPYHKGDALMPATPEMRYGRSKLAHDLTKPRDSAVVYGGRQLGKTTILHEAVRLVQEKGDVAGYTRVDQNITVGPDINEAWEACRKWVFNELHHLLFRAKLLTSPDALPNTDEEEKLIRQTLTSITNGKKILMCLDEVDPLLELDSRKDFRLFRSIVNLVQAPNSPLKVVIAGLQNVKRFEQVPNLPLNQLGGSMQVSILETQDAIDLVQEPLAIAGYYFADPMLINHVLVATNRHPGLIQAYCAKLLEYLHKDPRIKIGFAQISQAHLDSVSKDKDVQERIQHRFNMTLYVDRRYGVIIHGLIAEGVLNGASSVTASRVLGVARTWAPKWFGNTSEGNIEAFLDEMTGLGILRNIGGRKYALRNPSILRLIGDRSKAMEKLFQLIDEPDDDLLSVHRKVADKPYPSPLTLRDEQLLIKNLYTRDTDQGKHYSITMLVGSIALGGGLAAIRPALETIGSTLGEHPSDHPHIEAYKDTALKNVSTFKQKLIETMAKRATKPSIFLVELSGQLPLAHTLSLIDVARLARAEAARLNHNIAVVFLMGPESAWQWHLNPEITVSLNETMNWIDLSRWSRTSLQRELDRNGLANTGEAISHFEKVSDGWYASIVDMIDEKKKLGHLDTATVQDIKNYQGIARATQSKLLNDFIANAGLNIGVAPWLRGMLGVLAAKPHFDMDDAGYYMLEAADGIDSDEHQQAVVDWLVRFGFVEYASAPGNKREVEEKKSYRVTQAIANALRHTGTKT